MLAALSARQEHPHLLDLDPIQPPEGHMPEYKSQHYVPRSYLKLFTDPDTPEGQEPYLWIYEWWGDGKGFRKAPKNVAVSTYYYSFEADSGELEHGVERDVLSRAEGAAMPHLVRLIRGEDPAALDEQARMDTSAFLALMLHRTPRSRNHMESEAGRLFKHIAREYLTRPKVFERTFREAMDAAGVETEVDPEETRQRLLRDDWELKAHPVLSLSMMLRLVPVVSQYIFHYQWRVLKAPEGTAFLTSDAPLVMVSTTRLPGIWGESVGWESPWMEATFPLNPQTCLLISLHRPEGREELMPEGVREVNLRTMAHLDRQLFSSRRLQPSDLSFPDEWEWWTPVTDALLPPMGERDGSDDPPRND